MIREFLKGDGWIVALGILVGAVAVLGSAAPAAGFIGVAIIAAGLYRPSVAVGLAFAGILLDARGLTGLRVLGVPLTYSKMAVLFSIFAHFTNAAVRRTPFFQAMPITTSSFAILMTMTMSLIAAIQPSLGYTDLAGVLMLAVMAHLIYQAIDEDSLPWLMRGMSAVTVSLLLWTLLTQRKEGFFVTASDAWQQRTTGAYGDPNAWCTALLVVCPMLIAAMSVDRHPLATPLLIGLGVTFPAAVLQSISRAGLLSFVIISPGILYILRRRRTLLGVAMALLILSLPFTVNIDAMLLRYSTLLDPTIEADLGGGSLRERRALLEAGLKIFSENPFLGVGVGLFRTHASYVSAGEVWKIAHNSYVNVAAEQGIPGLLSHTYFGLQLYRAAWNGATRAKTSYTLAIGQGFLLSLLAFSAMAFTLNLATFAAAWFMMSLGMVVARVGDAEYVPEALDRARAALPEAANAASRRLSTPTPEIPA